jgi:uncharacterized protein (DUF1330 family)
MPLTLCVLLWPVAGAEDQLVAYEDAVLALLPRHGGRLVSRLRAVDPGDGGSAPYEIHTIEFTDDDAFQSYLSDPQRQARSAQRDEAIARTEVVPVDVVEP